MDNISVSISVSKSPLETFEGIKNVKEWWVGNIIGSSQSLGDEFTYQYKDLHKSTQRVVKLIPGEKIVWEVIDGTLNFINNKSEWVGTKIVFDISSKNVGSLLQFTHVGITPESECYSACSPGWSGLIKNNLRNFIEDGIQSPNPFE